MRYLWLFFSGLCAAAFIATPLSSSVKPCCENPWYDWASLRYTGPKGIGYPSGYLTAEFYVAPSYLFGNAWSPFLDVRGHCLFGDGLAANLGAGARYLASSRIWGGNCYYDYRNTHRQHYNQVSVGFETLGTVWDFRLNGYLPVGKTRSKAFHYGGFDSFQGHHMLIKSMRDFAMRGVNAEAGFHLDRFPRAPMYFAGGPYYLSCSGKTTWGGALRATVDLFDHYIRIEGSASYDHFFKWIGQGQIGLNFPLWRGDKNTQKKDCPSPRMMTMLTRITQRIDRQEIIPVAKLHVATTARDPATGDPLYFIFVNNTSSSNGTFESPYPTLAEASANSSVGDILYVFPGNGSAYDTASGDTSNFIGLALQDAQMLLGASTPHSIATTRGVVLIPPLASTLPVITTSGSGSSTADFSAIVTLANNNTVSGFSIQPASDPSNHTFGIAGTGIANFTSTQNTFTFVNHRGFNLSPFSGLLVIDGITFNGIGANCVSITTTGTASLNISNSTFPTITGATSNGIFVNVPQGSASLNVSGCTFSDMTNSSHGIFAQAKSTGGVIGVLTSSNITGCTFNGMNSSVSHPGFGITYDFKSGAILTDSNISGCTFNDIDTNSSGIVFNIGVSSASAIVIASNISECTFNSMTNTSSGIAVNVATGATFATSNISGCTFNTIDSTSKGIPFAISSTGILTSSNISECVFNNLTGYGFSSLVNGTGENNSLALSDNTFNGSSPSAAGWGASITVSAGTTCLDFADNTATPTTSPNPYLFTQSGSGVFNRTTGSNTGSITTSGSVGAEGSCSE